MYLKQRDCSSCAPLAFLHAARWQGVRLPASALREFKTLLGWEPGLGTWQSEVKLLARKMRYRRMYQPSIEKMDAALVAGNALLVDTRCKDGGGHMYFIPARLSSRSFVVANLGGKLRRMGKRYLERNYFIKPLVYIVPRLMLGTLEWRPNYSYEELRANR